MSCWDAIGSSPCTLWIVVVCSFHATSATRPIPVIAEEEASSDQNLNSYAKW